MRVTENGWMDGKSPRNVCPIKKWKFYPTTTEPEPEPVTADQSRATETTGSLVLVESFSNQPVEASGRPRGAEVCSEVYTQSEVFTGPQVHTPHPKTPGNVRPGAGVDPYIKARTCTDTELQETRPNDTADNKLKPNLVSYLL